MRHPLLVPDLRELLHGGEVAGIRDFMADFHPGRAAELIEDLETSEADSLFEILPPRNRAQVLTYFDKDRQARLVKAMPPKEAAELLHLMSHDEAPTWSRGSTRRSSIPCCRFCARPNAKTSGV